jgi:14-3-3 protein epsilon
MADLMWNVGDEGSELSVEERNLRSVAYKNVVGSRRAVGRIITSILLKELPRATLTMLGTPEYCIKVESDLQKICDTILKLFNDKLIPRAPGGESKMFYQKMMTDCYRYIAEFTDDEKKAGAAENAAQVAEKDLAVTHPIRLGLALNYSELQFEVLHQPDEACKMARTAFEDAIAELGNVAEDSYKDSTLIRQLLRENLTRWTSDQEGSDN